MLASKENARKVLRIINEAPGLSTDFRLMPVREFIEAASKRLPTEASFKRDRAKRLAARKTK